MRTLIVAILAGAWLLAGCGEEQVPVKLTVTAVGQDGAPISGADVAVGGRAVGATDTTGRLILEERHRPGTEVRVEVTAPSAKPWQGSFVVRRTEGGAPDVQTLEARLERAARAAPRVARGAATAEPSEAPDDGAPARGRATDQARGTGRAEGGLLAVRALTESYGTERGVAGVRVYVDDRLAGTTDARGRARVSLPATGKALRVTLAAEDHVPARWSMELRPGGAPPKELRRFFYPVTPEAIRVGLAGYTASTGAEPRLADGIARLEESLADTLSERKAFVQVPDLPRKLDFVKLTVDDLTRKGWDRTPLRGQLDLLVTGSVAGQGSGPFTIETRVYTANGRLLLAHVKEARDLGRPRDLTRDLAEEIVARFPFEGTVLEVLDGGRLRINLGSGGGREVETGTRFHLFAAETDRAGRVVGRREVGLATVARVAPLVSELRPEPAERALAVGDRVVRALLDDPAVGATGAVRLRVRAQGDGEPVAAANVYLDGAWVGATDRGGEIDLPIRPRRRYELLVFKHGFQQARETASFPQAQGERDVTLVPAAARFTVESVPDGAAVTVDARDVGRTPIVDPVEVRLGFRRVKVDAGGDHRAFDKVIEFAAPDVRMTGADRIVLEKDVLRIGERLLAEGRPSEAMTALAEAGPTHPDYSAARHRLGQLYLDEKKDADAAIAEFERVIALPENRELIFKRFAVVYTNLGHAYYARGQARERRDPEGAALAYRKALEALSTARQNTRFFPTSSHDEAIHDTYYYNALATHRLADLTRSADAFRRAERAWRDYLDFFPKRLEGNTSFDKAREGAEQFHAEARRRAS